MTRYCDDVALHGDMQYAELLLEPSTDSSDVIQAALFSEGGTLITIGEVEKRKNDTPYMNSSGMHFLNTPMTSGMMLNWQAFTSASGMSLQRQGSAWLPVAQTPSGKVPPPPSPPQAPGFTIVTR